ncbi:THO complex subunit 4 [Brachionus plicatilis]|uniref:THO complex subunit 4 n=1 Tax=Brachionus plicatilis TaxID=10195 RepID=A0A3M7QF15_BRAPC|nr:THO complex subunit 4 [Brachionus plicatilis]
MDKSLDEYAKEKKIGGRRGGGRRGGGGRFNASGRSNGAPGGAIQKRRSGGGLSPNKANASINGKWTHDLYQESSRFKRSNSAGTIGTGQAKLVISNLDFGVTDSDIQGLFAEFGKIRRAAVHYDRTGRSLGTADVLFERKSDAIRALTHYNGVSLDGRPMNIQLTTSLSATGNRSGGRRSLGNNGGRRGGRGGVRRGPNREPKSIKSAADLDAELDAHNAKMQTD